MTTKHWTERSVDDFLYRIGADFVRQIEDGMSEIGVNQKEMADRLEVSEGRVSQVLNNPGNLSLRKIVQYARVLGRKVAIVAYNDDDPDNINGPISSDIFVQCWKGAGMPADFFALQEATTNFVMYQIGVPQRYPLPISITKRAATTGKAAMSLDNIIASTAIADTKETGERSHG